MPQFDASTPRSTREFAGHKIAAPTPFTEGHPLTANEASWLNTQVGGVVGNAFGGAIRRAVASTTVDRIKAAIPAGKKQDAAVAAFNKSGTLPDGVTAATPADLGWDMQATYDKLFGDYTLGESNRGSGGSSTSDPVEALIRTFSVLDIKARLAAKGLKVAPLYKAPPTNPKYKSKWDEMVEENILASENGTHKNGVNFRAQAEAQLANFKAEDSAVDPLIDGIAQAA